MTADARLPESGKLSGKVIGSVVPNEYVSVVAVSARTGDIAAPFARIPGGADYALYGLATQWIKLGYSGGPAETPARRRREGDQRSRSGDSEGMTGALRPRRMAGIATPRGLGFSSIHWRGCQAEAVR
ncbi:hypothetical protein [Actinomadura mexicana]|uniref:hypothetical protein n=1 Tax=Actinomadura mexicana TaxID=134959 RepID=UPI0011781779|nr:hypothetical protein [Actinomadura mexicana]